MRILLWILVGAATAVLTAAIALRVLNARDRDAIAAARGPLLVTTDSDVVFTKSLLEGLPEPAARYFRHAIAEGTALRNTVELTLQGEIRLDSEERWATIDADYSLSPLSGYVWRMEILRGKIGIAGSERYIDQKARIRYWWNDFLPSTQEGPDTDRTSRERLALDRIFVPFTLLPLAGVSWEEIGVDHAAASFDCEGDPITLLFKIAADGSLISVETHRWGNLTEDHAFTSIPFGATITAEETFGGITIPSRLSYSWWRKTEREQEFLRPIVTDAHFY